MDIQKVKNNFLLAYNISLFSFDKRKSKYEYFIRQVTLII